MSAAADAAASATRTSAAHHAAQVDQQLAASRLALAAAQSGLRSPKIKAGGAPSAASATSSAMPFASQAGPSSNYTLSSITSHTSYEEKRQFASPGRGRAAASSPTAAASSRMGGAASSPVRRPVTPSSFSPNKIFARPVTSNAAPNGPTVAQTSAATNVLPPPQFSTAPLSPKLRPLVPAPYATHLSPREQARIEIERHGLGQRSSAAASGAQRSPHLTSPPRSYEPGSTVGAGGAFSHFAATANRARSLSPNKFSSTSATSAASRMGQTLRFENLASPVPSSSASIRHRPVSPTPLPAPIRPVPPSMTSPTRSIHLQRSSSASPIRSPPRSSFTASRPSALDSAAMRATTQAMMAASANGVYVHAALEPWRELNKQLALNGFPMVHPFPVPVSVSADAALPWSPTSSKYFAQIPREANSTPSASLTLLLTTCANLLQDYARRGHTIQELMAKNAETSSSHLHCHAEIAALRRSNQQQAYQITDLQQALEHSTSDRANTLKSLSQQIDQAAVNFSALESKHSHAVHQLAQKESTISEMKYQMEELQSRAERKVAQEVDRAHSLVREHEIAQAAVNHTAQATVRDLERQLSDAQVTLVAMQAAKKDAEEASQQRESHAAYVNNLRALESEERLRAAQIAHQEEVASLRARAREIEIDLSSKLRHSEETLGLSTAQVAELTTLNGLLRADLTNAQNQGAALEEQVSHLKQETRLQNQLHQEMESKVSALQAQAIHGYNLQELTKHLSNYQATSGLMRREHLAASFDLSRLAELPKEILLELLMGVCLKLKVHDATQVPAALDNLIAVASAVPGMQDFIGQIWSVVGGPAGGDMSNLSPDSLVSLTTSVIPTLRSWASQSQATRGLTNFKLEVLDVLRRRQHRSPLNPLHTGVSGSHAKINSDLPLEEILLELNDIVANENRLNALVYDQNTPTGFFQLWAAMDKSPLLDAKHYSADSEKIIAHLQQLFDIPHRIGLFPKINELFLFVNETRPAIQAMRSLLRLDSKATIHTCIKTLKRVVEGASLGGAGGEHSFYGGAGGGEQSFAGGSPASSYRTSHSPARHRARSQDPSASSSGGRSMAWTVTSPSKHEASYITSSVAAASSAPSAQQMQRNAAYYTVCKQLKAILGVRKIAEIVPAVQRQHSLSGGGMGARDGYLPDSILAQLKSILEVQSVTDLPSAAMYLRDNNESLSRQVQNRGFGSSEGARPGLAAKREELVAQLKAIVGVAGEGDEALASAVQRLAATGGSGSTSGGGGGGAGGAGSSDASHTAICMQLKGYLGVPSVKDIVETVRKLINRVQSYGQTTGQRGQRCEPREAFSLSVLVVLRWSLTLLLCSLCAILVPQTSCTLSLTTWLRPCTRCWVCPRWSRSCPRCAPRSPTGREDPACSAAWSIARLCRVSATSAATARAEPVRPADLPLRNHSKLQPRPRATALLVPVALQFTLASLPTALPAPPLPPPPRWVASPSMMGRTDQLGQAQEPGATICWRAMHLPCPRSAPLGARARRPHHHRRPRHSVVKCAERRRSLMRRSIGRCRAA